MSGFFTVAHFFNNSDVKLNNLTNFTETVWKFCHLSNSSVSLCVYVCESGVCECGKVACDKESFLSSNGTDCFNSP